MKKMLILFLFPFLSFGQYQYKTGHRDLVRFSDYQKIAGWNFAPGITYMGSRFQNPYTDFYEGGDTTYRGKFDPSGKIRLYLEVGRHRLFPYGRIFQYMDYGLAYKGLKGAESYEDEWINNTDATPFAGSSGSGEFAQHSVVGHFNLSNIWQVGDYSFIQNSIGANVDYAFIKNESYDGARAYTQFEESQSLPRLMAQLHYKIGYGIKITDKFFIIPSLETPILNIYKWTNFQMKVNQFNSQYRPLILSVRFAFIGQRGNSCPPVYGPEGDRNKQEQFMQQQ